MPESAVSVLSRLAGFGAGRKSLATQTVSLVVS